MLYSKSEIATRTIDSTLSVRTAVFLDYTYILCDAIGSSGFVYNIDDRQSRLGRYGVRVFPTGEAKSARQATHITI